MRFVRAGIRSLCEVIPGVAVVAEAGNGPEAVRLALAQSPDVVIMNIAMAGRGGIDAAAVELELALRAIARGDTYLSPGVSQHVVAGFLGAGDAPANPLAALTPRQVESLRLVALGKATKEIAFELGLSPKAVESHRSQLMERLPIRDVAGLVRLALRTGLIPADE